MFIVFISIAIGIAIAVIACVNTRGSSKTRTKYNVKDALSHLGVKALADLYTSSIADEVQVICLNLSGDINIGGIIRTASLFGVGKVHLLGRKRYDKRGAVGQYVTSPPSSTPPWWGFIRRPWTSPRQWPSWKSWFRLKRCSWLSSKHPNPFPWPPW